MSNQCGWASVNDPYYSDVIQAARQLFRISLYDLLDEWPVGIAVLLAIAAVLAPLLVINGLRTGVIGEIFERLRADPAMRRISLDATGATRFDTAWFRDMSNRKDVAFVLPSTRYAAAQVEIGPADGEEATLPFRVWLVPTGAGDPVFETPSPALDPLEEVKIAYVVAERAKLAIGEYLFIDVERRGDGGRVETAGVRVRVVDIAAPARHGGTVMFADPKLLAAIEAFRDGYAAPELGVSSGKPRENRTTYPSFRLYTRTIEDVAGLGTELRKGQGLSISTQEGPIASAIQLDQNIKAVLDAIMLLGAAGLAGSLCAIQWANALRKRRVVAMLSLIGYGERWVIGFPVLQASLLALAGVAVATLLAYGAAAWINRNFADSFGASGSACIITFEALFLGVGAVLSISLLPATMIGLGFARVEPSEEIRDV